MPKYQVVKNGTVVNSIVYDGLSSYVPPAGCTLVASETAAIGDLYDAQTGLFSKPE